MHIPSTGERVELRLGVDDSGLLYLESLLGGRVAYSLPGVISLGWQSWTLRPMSGRCFRRTGLKSRPRWADAETSTRYLVAADA